MRISKTWKQYKEYIVPIAGGTLGIFVGLMLFIFPMKCEDNSFYDKLEKK